MALSLVLCTKVDFLKFLFLFVVFLVRMWLAKALLRFTLPVPVTEKRLAAPLCVFIFGIIFTSLFILTTLFFRRHNHNHVSAFHSWFLIQNADID